MSQVSTRITPQDAYREVLEENAFLLDVRTPWEYAASHATDVSANIPHTEIAERAGELPRDRPIIAICASGGRSKVAAETLRTLGFDRVTDVIGGTTAWQKDGLPAITVKKVMPVDQQFRLILGAMVLIFTALGAFKSRKFLIGSGFIGTMLVITSLLGICPMLSVLQKMPWNRIDSR